MSATGRSLPAETGHVRHADDFYETPAWCTRAILKHLPVGNALDPCCGRGAILDVCHETGRGTWGIELDAQRADMSRVAGHMVETADALVAAWSLGDVLVTNPPYALAMAFVEKSLERPNRHSAFLLRLNWLESQERAAFHRAHPSDVYVMSRRPSFCASISCNQRKGGCGWHVTQPVDDARPLRCPDCSGKLTVTTSDSTAYAWFVWGPGRGNRWHILDVDDAT